MRTIYKQKKVSTSIVNLKISCLTTSLKLNLFKILSYARLHYNTNII